MERSSLQKSQSIEQKSKKSPQTRKIKKLNKHKLSKKIRDCLKKAEKDYINLNHYGKLQRRCKKMKGGYISKNQSISGTRTRTRTRSRSRSRSRSRTRSIYKRHR